MTSSTGNSESARCTHHWLIGPPAEKGVALARCKRCGGRREFILAWGGVYHDDQWTIERIRQHSVILGDRAGRQRFPEEED